MTKKEAIKACQVFGTKFSGYTIRIDTSTGAAHGTHTSGFIECDSFLNAMALQRAIRKAMLEEFTS